MAGDWIKVRSDLRDDPAVFKIAATMGVDRFAVVGRLVVFWAWVDAHAVDGFVDGASSTVVDDVTSTPGFSDALVAAKWLRVDAAGVYIPKHDRHNTESAKERNLKSERQARWRAKKAAEEATKPVDGAVDATPSTREEKRREEKKTPPKTPRKRRGAAAEQQLVSLEMLVEEGVQEQHARDWLANRRKKDLPLTPTAWEGVKTEAGRAGMDLPEAIKRAATEGWAGFKAKWLDNAEAGRSGGTARTDWTAGAH